MIDEGSDPGFQDWLGKPFRFQLINRAVISKGDAQVSVLNPLCLCRDLREAVSADDGSDSTSDEGSKCFSRLNHGYRPFTQCCAFVR